MEAKMDIDSQLPPFLEETLKSMKMPSENIETILEIYKRNIELMNTTQQIAMEATNTILELQRKHFQRAMDQWNEQMKSPTSMNPAKVKIDDAADATKNHLNKTLDHINEVNAVVEKSNKKIKDSFEKRLKESVNEVVELSKKK